MKSMKQIKNLIRPLLLLIMLLGGASFAWADDVLMVSWNTAPTCTNDNTDCSTTGSSNNLATWADGTTVKIMRGDKAQSSGSNITINGTSYKTIKVSNGAQNKLTMPSGKYAYAVDIYSYVNKKTSEAGAVGTYYWKEVNGTSYTSPALTCYSDGDLTKPDKASFTLGGVSTFTFNNAGTQLCYVLAISTTPITTQPADATYGESEVPSALTVAASSSAGTLTYQWYSCDDANKTNPSAIDGATSASYDGFSTATVGTYYYYCVVTDNNGSFASDVATITIVEASSLHTVTYSISSAIGVSGIVPAAVQASSVTIPTNTTLYKTGYTLTGWTDGADTYGAGDTYTPTEDVTLTAVFTANTESLSDFKKEKTITWYFGKSNGAADYNGSAAANVQQVKVKNTTIDLGIKMAGGSNEGRNDEWMNNQQKDMVVSVVKGAVVKAKVYYTNAATFNGENIPYDESYGAQGNVIYTYTYTGDDPADIAVNVGNQFLSYISVTYPSTGNAWANFENFAMDFRNGAYLTSSETNSTTIGFKKSGENIVRTTADDEDAIGTITARYHSNDHGLQNFSMSVAVPGYVKISAGTCAWGGNLTITGTNSFSHTVNTNTGACYHQNTTTNKVYAYYTNNEGTTLTIAGGNYMPFIGVEAVDFYTITGTIDGGNIDGTNVILTSQLTGQAFSATVASNAFTVNVPADTYDISLSSTESYVISTPTEVTVTAAAPLTINVKSSAPQTVTGDIANAPTTDFTLTFTGTGENVVNLNCNANATSFTTSLKPDTYTMSCADATLSTLSQESFTVVSSAVNHNIYFPETIPAATQAEITVDNTAAVSANHYKTVSDALAAAKAGNISSPVITLTSGQTYREQVIVDQANVTLKTSGTEKATITFYYGIGYAYYSLNDQGYYDKDRAMTRNSILMIDPARWGCTVKVTNKGTNFKAENIIFENSFNQYYTDEEVTDGVRPNGVQKITYDRTLTSGQSGYKAADSKAVTERAAAIGFENNPTGVELYNCEFRGSQDTFYSSGKIHVKNCNIIGNTDYIFGGGYVVFDNCDLTIGGYSDQNVSAYITAYRDGDNLDANKKYVFRDCTVKPSARTYYSANLGRDWGGAAASVYYFNLKNEIGDKLSYSWNNMGGGVSAGTADLHIYDFEPTVNANYNTTGSTGANVNGVLTEDEALPIYANVVTTLGFTPAHIYEDVVELGESSAYNKCRIAASDNVERNVTLARAIGADKWNTIVLPFDMSAEQISATFGEGTQVAALTSGTAEKLSFSTVTTMTANQPYAIKVPAAIPATTLKSINGVTIKSTTPTQDVDGDWQFVGTYAAGNIPQGSFFFSGNQLWEAEDDTNTIKGFRAWFTYNGANAARSLTFSINDETTDIAAYGLNNKEEMTNNKPVYNLNGQRVTKPQKGLYIINGRKVVMK